MKILVLNGPNLNKLGQRDTGQYGTETLEEIQEFIRQCFPDYEFTFIQSNREGELVDVLQSIEKNSFEGVVANFGGYSHTSVAIRDAIELINIPVIEVHLSNIHTREEFRKHSITGSVAEGVIAGFGKYSYILGIHALEKLLKQ